MNIKCSKIQNANNFVRETCLTETFPFTQIENLTLKNYNFACSCLRKGSYSRIHKNYRNNTLNLTELTFNESPDYSAKDTNVNVTNPACFNYYMYHDFHKLNRNINSRNNKRFSFVCSFHGKFDSFKYSIVIWNISLTSSH